MLLWTIWTISMLGKKSPGYGNMLPTNSFGGKSFVSLCCGGKFLKKTPLCLEALCRGRVPANWPFWNFRTSSLSNSVYLFILGDFFRERPPRANHHAHEISVQILSRPGPSFSEIFHHDPKTIGKAWNVVSWSECQHFLWFFVSLFIVLCYYSSASVLFWRIVFHCLIFLI